MSATCPICGRPARVASARSVAAGKATRRFATRYLPSDGSLRRHRDRHVSVAVVVLNSLGALRAGISGGEQRGAAGE